MIKSNKKKLLFVYYHKYPQFWRDGLWAALKLLNKDFQVVMWNMALTDRPPVLPDFVLGWGAFGSPVDMYLSTELFSLDWDGFKIPPLGLCLAGNATSTPTVNPYKVIFYETEWVKDNYLKNIDGHMIHAFGVNTDIYNKWDEAPIIWDWLSVGSFSYWKRHERIIAKSGTKLVVGEIQKDNWSESFDIISDLLLAGVGVSDMLYPSKLRNIYNCAERVYVPADLNGGGERCVLEARSCGRHVEVESDNPKLQELVNGPLHDQYYYANQLKHGIMELL